MYIQNMYFGFIFYDLDINEVNFNIQPAKGDGALNNPL